MLTCPAQRSCARSENFPSLLHGRPRRSNGSTRLRWEYLIDILQSVTAIGLGDRRVRVDLRHSLSI
jgi:hypothetical protein